MYQGRIVDILVVLMDEIKSRGIENERMELISNELLKQGYSEQEISTAFSWILERVVYPIEDTSPDPKSYRVLHNIEKIFISGEAYGFLIQLSTLGMLSHNELERVIEKALMESIPAMGIERIKSIIAEVILNVDDIDFNGEDIFIPDDLIQ